MKRLLMDSKTALLYVHAVCLQLSHLSRSFSVPRSLLSSCSSFRLHVFLCIRRPMWASLACNVDVWDAAIDPFYRTAVHTGPRVVLIPDMQSTQRERHTHTHTHVQSVESIVSLEIASHNKPVTSSGPKARSHGAMVHVPLKSNTSSSPLCRRSERLINRTRPSSLHLL